MNFIINYYSYIKIIHLIALISLMAGMLYLPRLFVYHAMQDHGSVSDKLLQTMERKLLRIIINPGFIITIITGLMLSYPTLKNNSGGNYWLHCKILLVILMGGVHGMLSSYRKKFLISTTFKTAKYFRILNEAPTILMIFIVILVILKPF